MTTTKLLSRQNDPLVRLHPDQVIGINWEGIHLAPQECVMWPTTRNMSEYGAFILTLDNHVHVLWPTRSQHGEVEVRETVLRQSGFASSAF